MTKGMGSKNAIQALIVDDEPGARRRLKRLLEKEVDVAVVGQAKNGRDAVTLIETLRPDLVFLDVQMPVMDGIEVIQHIGASQMPLVIFVTAYDQFAVKAFELAALDYLLKPFDDERFEQTLARIRTARQQTPDHLTDRLKALIQSYQQPKKPSPNPYLERIAVDIRGQLHIIPISKIDFITASGNYVYLHAEEQKWLVREQMQVLEDRLPPRLFYRIHRSAIVRLDQIERLVSKPGGDYAVVLNNGKPLKVSRNRWGELARRLGIQVPSGDQTS